MALDLHNMVMLRATTSYLKIFQVRPLLCQIIMCFMVLIKIPVYISIRKNEAIYVQLQI